MPVSIEAIVFVIWDLDPQSMGPQKALEAIGANLQRQYERWQPRARYKQSLDPTVEDIKKLCTSLRRNAKVSLSVRLSFALKLLCPPTKFDYVIVGFWILVAAMLSVVYLHWPIQWLFARIVEISCRLIMPLPILRRSKF